MLLRSDFKICLSVWHWALELTVSVTRLKLFSPWREVKLGALSPGWLPFLKFAVCPPVVPSTWLRHQLPWGGGLIERRFGTGDLASNPISPAGQLVSLRKSPKFKLEHPLEETMGYLSPKHLTQGKTCSRLSINLSCFQASCS